MIPKIQYQTLRLVRSPKFFYVVIAVLCIQAAWIALTARYPQAFDENFHFGLIKLHSHQLLPFFTSQPDGAAVQGAVIRDPSYFYHYIMSLPFRLLTVITNSQTAQIIVLRFLNIGLFVGGLLVYQKLFKELRISTAITNVVLLFFVLIPVVPLLAGQINYDNMMFLCTGLLFLYSVRYARTVNGGVQRNRQQLLTLGLQVIIFGSLGSIVKFPFVPIFLALFVILTFITIRRFKKLTSIISAPLDSAETDTPVVTLRLVSLVIIALLFVSLGIERYGTNLLQYHTPVPACNQVISKSECMEYSPFARDALFAAILPRPNLSGIITYPAVWAHRMVYESMFSITSYQSEVDGLAYYTPQPPLTVANYTAWIIVTASGLSIILCFRTIIKRRTLVILLMAIGFYIAILFSQNFSSYLNTGEVVSVHGRYLIPIYPILLLVAVLSIGQVTSWLRLAKYNYLLVVITLTFFLQGGGIIGWIVHSDSAWYWQQLPVTGQVNRSAQAVLKQILH